ncbi:putative protein rot1 [Phaeomoniella chlamydospora]|uniref:Protein ROT1 n=1 Tax=Phaeomoniella chlamydospora TaxID=158046 RepID=A0A0G2GBF2_PHACM|nr:putative protein rot1 [Phaeomoniella chlamydospora]
MLQSISPLLLLGATLTATVAAEDYSDLVGTWSTKSRKVITGPGFYNPETERFTEPSLTGISYSFTSDGYFEEAYYRAVSNPANPSCPSGVMQWQHGTFTKNSSGSLILKPFSVDGRQLLSEPCEYDTGVYTRYDQEETFERYSVYVDGYHNIKRLDLYQFDGSPMNPMYLVYDPPEMLPTSTLNPTSTAKSKSRVKRDVDAGTEDIPQEAWNKDAILQPTRSFHYDADLIWWTGVTFTALGGLLYMYT